MNNLDLPEELLPVALEEKTWQQKIEEASKNLQQTAGKRKKQTDKHGEASQYKVGELVWIKIHRRSDASRRLTRKIYLVYDRPYQVLRIIRKNAYLLGDLEGESIGTANSRQLKPHREAMLYQQQEDAQSEDPSEEGINYVHYNESRRRGRRNQLPRRRECRT